jgi:hypothetical protein
MVSMPPMQLQNGERQEPRPDAHAVADAHANMP